MIFQLMKFIYYFFILLFKFVISDRDVTVSVHLRQVVHVKSPETRLLRLDCLASSSCYQAISGKKSQKVHIIV